MNSITKEEKSLIEFSKALYCYVSDVKVAMEADEATMQHTNGERNFLDYICFRLGEYLNEKLWVLEPTPFNAPFKNLHTLFTDIRKGLMKPTQSEAYFLMWYSIEGLRIAINKMDKQFQAQLN